MMRKDAPGGLRKMKRSLGAAAILSFALIGSACHHHPPDNVVYDPPCLPAPPPHMPSAPLPEGAPPEAMSPSPHDDDSRPTHQERSCEPHHH